MHSSDQTLAQAMYQLAHEIDSPDGVANAAIFEAATRLEYYAKPIADDQQREIVNRIHAKLRDKLPDAPAWLRTAVREAVLPEIKPMRKAFGN